MLWSFIVFLCFNKNWRTTSDNEIIVHEKSPESKTKGIKFESILYTQRKLIFPGSVSAYWHFYFVHFSPKLIRFRNQNWWQDVSHENYFLLKKGLKKWNDLYSFMFLSWWSSNYQQKVLFSWYVLFPARNLSLSI